MNHNHKEKSIKTTLTWFIDKITISLWINIIFFMSRNIIFVMNNINNCFLKSEKKLFQRIPIKPITISNSSNGPLDSIDHKKSCKRNSLWLTSTRLRVVTQHCKLWCNLFSNESIQNSILFNWKTLSKHQSDLFSTLWTKSRSVAQSIVCKRIVSITKH